MKSYPYRGVQVGINTHNATISNKINIPNIKHYIFYTVQWVEDDVCSLKLVLLHASIRYHSATTAQWSLFGKKPNLLKMATRIPKVID